MEFLDNFVLPQSAEHIHLLHYMLILILFLFIPFVSILFGGTFLSLYFNRKGIKNNDQNAFSFARQIMEIVTINKGVGFILGIVPLITSILIYAQLLHTSPIKNLNYLAVSCILFVIALVLIYSYRYSLSFNEIFKTLDKNQIKNKDVSVDVERFSDESLRISRKSGKYGLLFLFLALWFFITGMSIPIFYENWQTENFIANLFEWKIISRFIYYLLAAFVLTGGMIFFRVYEINGKSHEDKSYDENFFRKSVVRFTLTPAIILPALMLINLISVPDSSLSSGVFVYMLIALFLLFLGYHFLYLISVRASGTIAAVLFFTLLLSVNSNIISDQLVMSNSTKIHSAVLGQKFDKYLAELKGTGTVVEFNGEEIYKVRCESCHRFDQKLVGPPHFDVLPKYVGKEALLIAFIRNPIKVDPAYPQMPNPGLKPKEAEAVAIYLLKTYESKLK